MENDLKFSGVTPVVINYNGSEDDIYAPVRSSSCDINIVSDKILDDIYTAQKDNISVRVSKITDTGEERVVIDDNKITSFDSNCALWFIDANGNEFYNPLITNAYCFTDIDGDQCAVLTINSTKYYCVYDESRNAYVENDKWKLSYYSSETTYEYLTDGTNSYLWVRSDTSSLSYPVIYTWSSTVNNWSGGVSQRHLNNSMNFERGLCYSDGTYVYWFYRSSNSASTYSQYVLNTSNKKLISTTQYTRNNNVLLKVVGLTSDNKPIILSDDHNNDCQVLLTTGTTSFTKWSDMPGQDEYDHYQVFSDKSGIIYCLPANSRAGATRLGSIWMHNMSEEDPEWSTLDNFDGTVYTVVQTMLLVAQKEHGANVYWKIYDGSTYHNYSLVMDSGWYSTEHIIEKSTLWEGYKMPNTYSQSVTQNLDQISMTAIDPISILKYVTIDKLVSKPKIMTYRELIGTALSYVKLTKNRVRIETAVSYGGNYYYAQNNGLLGMKIQVSNFWNEGGEPATAYEMLEEMLRPFCMTLAFNGDTFQIWNPNKTNTRSVFLETYIINDNGTLSYNGLTGETQRVYDFDNGDWISNNTQDASIEIGSTYDKVTGVASTSVPEYSQMVYDVVDYNQRDLYDILHLNVQRNKTKGYSATGSGIGLRYQLDTADKWYYIWNGVYTSELYHLQSNGGYVNGYLNINKANTYLNGQAGHPDDYGSILNFYGGANNPTGTGKTQSPEKPVEVKRRITAYAADNGTPLEFLEVGDLAWKFDTHLDMSESIEMNPDITKVNPNNGKFGSVKAAQQSNKVSYKQKFTLPLSSVNDNTLNIDLTQSYSRTGIDQVIDVMQNNTSTNGYFNIQMVDEDTGYRIPYLISSDINYFPKLWNASNVKVDTTYFQRYKTAGTILRPQRITEVWDKRRIWMYIKRGDNDYLQFNGKDWVQDTHPESGNAFYLMKLMNGEKLFHTDYRYNIIETADGEHYSLTNERFTYYTDEVGGVTDRSVSGGTTHYCEIYYDESQPWYQWVEKCSEGKLSIKLPPLDLLEAEVTCDVYNSTLLGSTGGSQSSTGTMISENIKYVVEGTGTYVDDDQGQQVTVPLGPGNIGSAYGTVGAMGATVLFLPHNTTYVKAEHLDLDISLSVPESNLGQMFEQSDIKYSLTENRGCVEEFNNISFLVNTYNSLVAASYSYLIFGDTTADPNEFIIENINARPESYTIQAYMNWLSVIRKTYKKTLVPVDEWSWQKFCNIRTFLKSPEVGDNKLMVVADSWDVKSNRHSVTAVECQDLDVEKVENQDVIELPRRARDERYNLPTAVKK